MNDTNTTELENCECVSSAMTVTPILTIERQKRGTLGILQVIGDSVFVCICKVLSDSTKTETPHAFVYDSHFVQE